VFSAGGTGGHIFPALAIADEIKDKFPEADILFIGAKGKMEMERVPKAGYPIKGLWISGFLGKSIRLKIMSLIKLIHGILTSYFILRKHKPEAVVGFGGFASGPALLVAVQMGIPTMIQEQNSHPGMTNRFLGKRVDQISIAYEEVKKFFPEKEVFLLGNPIRKNLKDKKVSRKEALEFFNLKDDKKTILLLGGSLGARTLNRAMRELKKEVEGCSKQIQFIWQIGKLYIEEYAKTETAKLHNVRALAFLDRMDLAYEAADLVVARAGALTLSELAILGKAVLLVPSPNVSEDHQMKNAMVFVSKGAAQLLNDEHCERQLIKKIEDMLENAKVMEHMQFKIKEWARPDATVQIAEKIVRLTSNTRWDL